MRRYSRPAWQVIAVAAFAGTAALAVVLTRPQPSPVAACRTTGLDAWLGIAAGPGAVPRARASGSIRSYAYYTLEFTNVSGQTCSLYGYPDVWAYTGERQIGSPATLDTSIRPSVVTLAPGATAHAVLRYTRTAGFDEAACQQVTVPDLRVYPPRASGAVLVPLTIPACSRKGPGFLSVEPVQPRAGIPGFRGD